MKGILGLTIILTLAWLPTTGADLTLTGSTTVFPIIQAAAEEFMAKHPEVDITVRGGGSGVGIAALIDGICDIAMASRPMKTKEIKRARADGINPCETVIARDGLVIVVHPANPITSISTETLREIYTGKINSWKDVGGEGGTIVVISRDVASGTFEVFKKMVLKGKRVRADALMLASNKAVAQTVAQTPGAIGYIGLGYLSPHLKALKVDGVMPDAETISSGKYRLARPLFLYTNGKPRGLAKRFIDFILSPSGQKIVKETGYLPVR
ncbi:phosphate ABC transporter substrate-binding protein [candidate division WOR-3 bacterium]|uniref:Phosphate-binding protein n=1 Tax=candidate division WOR-3 bacterium TaxID=2052148 RepID=A0A660SL89_UNCW3|nr:MAG: phosphate ABC transporter substrate-binding protein [candidate division WOR-3 bacterium]